MARVAPRRLSIRPGVAGMAASAGVTTAPTAVSAKTVASTMPALRIVPPPVDDGSLLHRPAPPIP